VVTAGTKWQANGGKKEIPMVFNVGKDNGLLPLDRAFNAKAQPKAYILNADRKKIEERRKAKKPEDQQENPE
jgi:hypothetical protein